MNLIELLTFCLIIALAFGASQFAGERLGVVGYIAGFITGGAVIPLALWWLNRFFPPRNDR